MVGVDLWVRLYIKSYNRLFLGIKRTQGSKYQLQQVMSECVRKREEIALLSFACPLAQRFVICTAGM